MGYSTVAESHSRLPQTPPDFTSSSSSSFSARPNANALCQPPRDLFWPQPKPPISPPMSSHDQPLSSVVVKPSSPVPRPSSTDSASMSAASSSSAAAPAANHSPASSPRKHNDAPRPHVRETLPSLSSIFGPPENIRPLHPSPLERSRGSLTPTAMEPRRSPSLSYFPISGTPPASVSSLSQSSQPLPQPPRSAYHDDHDVAQSAAPRPWSDLRSGYAPASRWGAHPDSSIKAEYAPHGEHRAYYAASSPTDPRGPASSDYHRRQHQHQHEQQPPPPYASHSHQPRQYSPPPPMGLSRSPVRGGAPASMPLTPASSAYMEGALIPKEGMGPKIWTGVDFLPQFMHASDVPGEGLCFFYDDGSHCKAVIDGEPVNPYWGVTKAGKPRKRLAIACMTCREKKIKCDPEFPRCVQCEKFGRVCRFKNAPRGGNNGSPGTTASEPEGMRKMGSQDGMVRPPPPESPRQMAYPARSMSSNSTSSSSRAGMRRASSPDRMDLAGGAHYKRTRTDYDYYTTASRGRSPPYGSRSPTMPADAPRSGGLPSAPWGSGHEVRHDVHSPSLPPYSHMGSQPPSQSGSYRRHRYDDYRRSQPTSPSQAEPPRTLLPPPRSGPEHPRGYDDVVGRPWQHELRHHGRA